MKQVDLRLAGLLGPPALIYLILLHWEVYRMGTGLCLVVLLNIDVENIFRLQLTIFYFPVEQFGRNNNSLVVENTGVKELRRSVKENRFL